MRRKKISAFDVFNTLLMLVVILITVYPLYMQVILSIGTTKDAYSTGLLLFPSGIDLSGWKVIKGYKSLWRGYGNSIVRVILGAFLTLLVTTLYAYPLSKRECPMKKFFTIAIFIPMFFGGGMIPTYLQIRNLHLSNTIWCMVLPGMISGYNVFIIRNFYMTMDPAIEDAARIDGAGEFRIFWQIKLLLAKPVIATVGLWAAVGHWQEWFSNLLYIDDQKKWVVMMVTRKILVDQDYSSMAEAARNLGMGTVKGGSNEIQIRACVILITVLPMLVVYPFVQKYFVKGINLGATKG